MTTERRHRCGGALVPRDVPVRDEKDGMSLTYVVPGLVCEKCHEELIERETATKIQGSQTPTVAWRTNDVATTSLDARLFDLLPPASTQGVAA